MNDQSLPPNSMSIWVRWFPVTVAALEAAAVLLIGLVTLVGIVREGSDLRPGDVVFEMALFASGAVGMAWVARSLARGSARVVAPFVVAQALALVFAWDFIQSNQLLVQTAGLALGGAALISCVLLLGFRRWL